MPVLIYGVPYENELDIVKDIYDDRSVAIEDIPSTNVDARDVFQPGTKSSRL